MNILQNFAIGQYVPGQSFIHRLDPRSKLLFVIVFAILVFMANNPATYATLAVFVIATVIAAQIPLSYILKGLKPVWYLLIFTALLHILMTKGGTVYVKWGWFTIEQQGILQAIYISLRLGLLVLISSLLTLTTSPIDLTDGLERLLSPFRRVKLPVHEIAMMLSIALRFIPTLLEETEKIMKAQMSRGADFESGGLIKRAKSLIPVVIPLFISAFRRAEDLALAMEARGYRGGVGRTKLRQLHLTSRDLIVALITLILFICVGWWRA